MKVSVYDTYVPKSENVVMHFDILVTDDTSVEEVYKYGKEYLNDKGLQNYQLTTKECRFCHIENASEEIEASIKSKGFFIIEMENCN